MVRDKDPERQPLLSSDKACSPSHALFPDNNNKPLDVVALRNKLWNDLPIGLAPQDAQKQVRIRTARLAVEDTEMGLYQWTLFVICGLGWMTDNMWMHAVSLILPSLSTTFDMPEKQVRLTTAFLFLGLSIGALLFGVISDSRGRLPAFRACLPLSVIAAVFAVTASSWHSLCLALIGVGIGVGGSLPVDGTMLLETLPKRYNWLLVALSAWWPIGQLFAAAGGCLVLGQNAVSVETFGGVEGWRVYLGALTAFTAALALLRAVWRVDESLGYMVGAGKTEDVVMALRRRGDKTWLTVNMFDMVSEVPDWYIAELPVYNSSTSVLAHAKDWLVSHISPLFQTSRLSRSTILIWFVWAAIGMGYPLFNAFLPQYLSHAPTGDASPQSPYFTFFLTTLPSIPASFLSTHILTSPNPRPRPLLAVSTLLSAILLLLFPFAPTANTRLFLTCVLSFTQNIMYAVLYSYTPAVFPEEVRGLGLGVASFANRAMGLLAPVVAAHFPGDGVAGPVGLAGGLILSAFLGVVGIPGQ